MMEKRNRMIMFAVIAAIIIVAPISLYEFSSHSSGISVKSSNTVTNLTFAVNFTKYTDTSKQFNPNYENFTSETILDKGGLNQSILETSGIIQEFYGQGGGSFVLLNFNVSGSFTPNIAPSSLSLSLDDSARTSGNESFYQLLYGGHRGAKNNATITGVGDNIPGVGYISYGVFNHTQNVILDNVTKDSTQSFGQRYHFFFGEQLIIQIWSTNVFPFPFNITIQASLSGYSSQVFDQVNFHVEDVN